jgi:hypothetical protein
MVAVLREGRWRGENFDVKLWQPDGVCFVSRQDIGIFIATRWYIARALHWQRKLVRNFYNPSKIFGI